MTEELTARQLKAGNVEIAREILKEQNCELPTWNTDWLTVKELSLAIKYYTIGSIRQLIRRGTFPIPSTKIGARYMFKRTDVEAYMRAIEASTQK